VTLAGRLRRHFFSLAGRVSVVPSGSLEMMGETGGMTGGDNFEDEKKQKRLTPRAAFRRLNLEAGQSRHLLSRRFLNCVASLLRLLKQTIGRRHCFWSDISFGLARSRRKKEVKGKGKSAAMQIQL
jgi:hypothetical protein